MMYIKKNGVTKIQWKPGTRYGSWDAPRKSAMLKRFVFPMSETGLGQKMIERMAILSKMVGVVSGCLNRFFGFSRFTWPVSDIDYW